MKAVKVASALVLCAALMGCGHGFEGQYEVEQQDRTAVHQGLSSLVGGASTSRITIGADYIEAEGGRTRYEKIFERKSGDKRYLVFFDGKEEDAMEIVDENTLIKKLQWSTITLKRVKQ